MSKRVFITGITGMDGAHLSALLLSRGYEVIGGQRRSASGSLWRLDELGITKDVQLVPFDLHELPQMIRLLDRIQPDEIYNLAAQSFVAVSFEQPLLTADVDGMGVLRLLEAARTVCPTSKFYQASSSEMWGNAAMPPNGYNEDGPFYPRSPYGIAKRSAHWFVRNYREAHGMFACCGILANHESSLRGLEFVTRKITDGVARIACGENYILKLGNLEAKRDWGHARDYTAAMFAMMQHDTPDDYVIATGETHSVREFIDAAVEAAGMRFSWNKDGTCAYTSNDNVLRLVSAQADLQRPAEVHVLLGDASKARRVLGWQPTTGFRDLVREMVEADLRRRKIYAAQLSA